MEAKLRDRALELINKKLSTETLNNSILNAKSKKNKFKNDQKAKNEDNNYLKQLVIRLNSWLKTENVFFNFKK